MRIIFDLGCNKGQNFDYYFNRADKIIAVEANPTLYEELKSSYFKEIENETLILFNKVIVRSDLNDGVCKPFYVNADNDLLSSQNYSHMEYSIPIIKVAPIDLLTLIDNYVTKSDVIELIKIDLEGSDLDVISDLVKSDVQPKFVSFENHSKANLETIINSGLYSSFKLIEGRLVNRLSWSNLQNHERRAFQKHAAGPFGDDIEGRWLSANSIARYMNFRGEGWWDICASRYETTSKIKLTILVKGIFRRLYEFISKNLYRLGAGNRYANFNYRR